MPEIEKILESPVKDIIREILNRMEPYKVSGIRAALAPRWQDELSYEKLCTAKLFTKIRTENRECVEWGTNECVSEEVDIYKCDFCNHEDDIYQTYPHILLCDGFRKYCGRFTDVPSFIAGLRRDFSKRYC